MGMHVLAILAASAALLFGGGSAKLPEGGELDAGSSPRYSLMVASWFGPPPTPPPNVRLAVATYWHTAGHRREAIAVAWCESRYRTTASNGQYKGLFQMGYAERRKYGHGPTARAQTRAAWRYWRVAGWSPWSCRP